MSDTRLQLLGAIIANPGDLTLRLAYADWLEENTVDGWWASYIRAECGVGEINLKGKERASRFWPWPSLRFQYYKRTSGEVVISERRGAGAGSVQRPYLAPNRVVVKSGMTNEVRCTMVDWRIIGPGVCSSHPVIDLHISDIHPVPMSILLANTCSGLYGVPLATQAIIQDWLEELPRLHGASCAVYSETHCGLKQGISNAALQWARKEAGIPGVI